MNNTSGVRRIVGFSGGIDSQATALWVRQRFPAEEIILLNSDAGGNEHPTTSAFIEQYSRDVFPVVTVSAIVADLEGRGTKPGLSQDRRREFNDSDPLTFDVMAYIEGRFPSRKAQFCTEHLKLAPQRRWVREHIFAAGLDCERYVGVRRDESQNRRDTPDTAWDEYFDCQIVYPLAAWTKRQVFEFVMDAGEAFNPLYKMGFGRVGCAPCINSSKDDVLNWELQAPEMLEKIRQWEARVGRTFFPPIVPGMAINWIDDVMRWAKTKRGGRIVDFPMLDAARERVGSCSSRYGLCE